MSKHTPGPWKITQESVDPEWHIITAVGGRIMANVHIEPGNHMDEANACLLVAAPDLLAALRDILRILEAVRFTAGLGKKQMERIEKARAVLAKATTPSDAA